MLKRFIEWLKSLFVKETIKVPAKPVVKPGSSVRDTKVVVKSSGNRPTVAKKVATAKKPTTKPVAKKPVVKTPVKPAKKAPAKKKASKK